MNIRRLNQAGDTIIEVLVAVAVVSMVLASAFVTVNRTSKNARLTQENQEALKLAEGQLEAIRGLAGNAAAAATLFSTPRQFCVNKDGVTLSAFSATTYAGTNINTPGYYPDDGSHTRCVRQLTGEDYLYYISVSKPTVSTFRVNVDWNGPTANRANVSLIYEMYP